MTHRYVVLAASALGFIALSGSAMAATTSASNGVYRHTHHAQMQHHQRSMSQQRQSMRRSNTYGAPRSSVLNDQNGTGTITSAPTSTPMGIPGSDASIYNHSASKSWAYGY